MKGTLPERLKNRRVQLGLTLLDVAEQLDTSEATVQRYESGNIKNIPHEKIVDLAKILNCTPSYLMGWDELPNNILPEGAKPYNPIIHRIPILGYISAGLPLYAEEHIEDYTYTEYNGGAEYFALRVKGDSMNAAKINDGDLLIVRRQETVENGEIAVIMVNNDNATVKRFKRQGNTVQLIPQSYNAEHQIQLYDLKKDAIRILGKVVECKVEIN